MQLNNTKRKRILHISTHLGGGVGTVLFNYFKEAKKNKNYIHKVIALGYTEERAYLHLKKLNLEYKDNMASSHNEILKAITESDIVVIHWWNHPLIFEFLVKNTLPNCRVIIWSHVSGFHSPHVFGDKILNYPDIFTFTTPISLDTPEVRKLPNNKKRNLRVILATGGISHLQRIKRKRSSVFHIGYIGTVDYAKMHPQFLRMCKEIKIPDAQFTICGGSYENKMRDEATKIKIDHKLIFTGKVSNIEEYLRIFDVFGYPLAKHHYGACDQVLIECMAAGVVPVVFNNRMERFMVKNGETGIIVNNKRAYVKAINELYQNQKLLITLSVNAKKYAKRVFSIEKMAKDWEKNYKDALKIPPSIKTWPLKKTNPTAADIFIESLSNHGKVFSLLLNTTSKIKRKIYIKKIEELGARPAWQSDSKGTVHNYNAYLPNDKHLSFWSRIMKSNQNNGRK